MARQVIDTRRECTTIYAAKLKYNIKLTTKDLLLYPEINASLTSD